MAKIADLLTREIQPGEFGCHKSQITEVVQISQRKQTEKRKEWAEYEDQVFDFLLKNKTTCGVQKVFRFKNLRVDGAIKLSNGGYYIIEVKYRMNWLKACQAEAQFRYFFESKKIKKYLNKEGMQIQGALVFFEEFHGAGWERQLQGKNYEKGWDYWYLEHAKVGRFRLDLLRIRDRKLESYPA